MSIVPASSFFWFENDGFYKKRHLFFWTPYPVLMGGGKIQKQKKLGEIPKVGEWVGEKIPNINFGVLETPKCLKDKILSELIPKRKITRLIIMRSQPNYFEVLCYCCLI